MPCAVPVAVSVCAMLVPDDADAPDTPVGVTVQAKVVPVTFPDKAIALVLPEHSDWDEGAAIVLGVGLTVIVKLCGIPGQVVLPFV